MNDPKREKTNSVTHLVKIIAEEVFDKKIKNITINDHRPKQHITIDMSKAITKIQNQLSNRGDSWNRLEDEILANEVHRAIDTIAANHGRTHGAISARIYKNHLLS